MNQALASLAECLDNTLKEDRSLRDSAEEQLATFSKNPQEMLTGLLQIITMPHPDLSSQLKNSSALYIKKLVKEACESPYITKDQRLYFANSIFSVLSTICLESTVRGSLGYSLMPVFSGQGDVISSFLPSLIHAMASPSSNALGSIKAIKSIYGGFSYIPVLFPFFKKILPSFLEIAKDCMKSLRQALESQNNTLALESSENLYEWSSAFTSMLEYFDITSKQSLSEIKDIAEIPQVFFEIVSLLIPDPELSSPSIINISPNSVHIRCNQAKAQIFQSFNLIVQYLQDYKKKIAESEGSDPVLTAVGLDMSDSPYLNSLSDLLPLMVASAEGLCLHPRADSLLDCEYISEPLTEVLLILTRLAADNRYLPYFAECYPRILVQVCFPLLKSTQADLETFAESPEEFVALSSDVCERQESETVKSTAAQLLEGLCTRVDGGLRFLLTISCEIIDWTVTRQQVEAYPNLLAFASSGILQASEELRIDTSILAMCIVSYFAGRRRDLVRIVEHLMGAHLNLLYTNGTGLIKNRLCMLIQYYCEYVFVEDNVAFHGLLLVILNCASPKLNDIPGVNVQASETLSFMLKEEEVLCRIYSRIPEVMELLIKLIDCQNSKGFFEALQEIISTNINIVIPHVAVLVPALVSKVVNEVGRRKEKKKKNSIIIVKCWNIIRTLVECNSFSVEQVMELETKFAQLLEFIKTPKDIEFDDDIILFEVAVMRKCKAVTQIGWSVFPHLPMVQDKYDNTFVQLFQILNCYIYYGTDVIRSNPASLMTICEMCGKCLFAVYKNKINEATNAEAALIYQQILYTFKGEINDVLPSILAFAILKLTTPIKNDFFKARILGIILAGFSYDCESTYQILSTSSTPTGQTYFEYIFSEITANTRIFRHPYDKKVAVTGLSSFFSNLALANTYPIVFQLLIDILGNTYKDVLPVIPDIDEGSKNSKISMKDPLRNFNSEEMEASLGLTQYLSPLDNFDDYDYFRTLVQSFRKQDLATLVQALNRPQMEQLTNILQSKRVAIGGNPENTDVRRTVKAKSRKNH